MDYLVIHLFLCLSLKIVSNTMTETEDKNLTYSMVHKVFHLTQYFSYLSILLRIKLKV